MDSSFYPAKPSRPEQKAQDLRVVLEREKKETPIGIKFSVGNQEVVVHSVFPDGTRAAFPHLLFANHWFRVGPAARNGLQAHDVLAYLDGVDIRSLGKDHLMNTLLEATRETPSRAIVLRHGLRDESELSVIANEYFNYFSSCSGRPALHVSCWRHYREPN